MDSYNLYNKDRIIHLALPGHPGLMDLVWQTDDFVVVNFEPYLRLHKNYPYGKSKLPYMNYRPRTSKLKWVVYHQTYGNYRPNPESIHLTNNYAIDFLGWPRICYQLYCGYNPPQTQDGRYVVYQINPWNLRTWTIGGSANSTCAGVVFQGRFSMDHGDWGQDMQPSQVQGFLAEKMWEDYIKPCLGVTNKQISGHYEHGKPACPGRRLQTFVIQKKKEMDRVILV
jgi:hypothetical protein